MSMALVSDYEYEYQFSCVLLATGHSLLTAILRGDASVVAAGLLHDRSESYIRSTCAATTATTAAGTSLCGWSSGRRGYYGDLSDSDSEHCCRYCVCYLDREQ